MALSNLITWECRTTGNANNGGGFHTGASGTDRSQQNSAQVVIDNSTITCTTTGANSNTLTFTAGYTATAADVGNVVKITGGTNINTGYYEITGFTATTWTVTGATNLTTAGGAGSAITGNMGGAADSPVTINSSVVAGNLVYIQSGTYNLAATLTLTSGTVASGVSKPTVWVGYSTTRTPTNTDTQPVLASNNNALSPCVTVGSYNIVRNIKVDGSGATNKAARGFTVSGTDLCMVERCTASVFTDCGFLCQQNGQAINCYATGGTSAASNGGFNLNSHAPSCIDCVADSNANAGFVAAAASAGGFINCIASNNTTANGHGFSLASGGASPPMQNCVAYNNAGDGIRIAGSFTETMYIRNCILVKNAGYGINSSTGDNRSTSGTPAGTPLVDYNAFFSNTLGVRNQIDAGPHDVTLTGDPLVNGTTDFSLNNTAGAGAACKAVAFPGALLFGGTGFLDLGALQSQASGGAAGMLYIPDMTGGCN